MYLIIKYNYNISVINHLFFVISTAWPTISTQLYGNCPIKFEVGV